MDGGANLPLLDLLADLSEAGSAFPSAVPEAAGSQSPPRELGGAAAAQAGCGSFGRDATLAAAQAESAEALQQSQFAENQRQADRALLLAAASDKRERERQAETARQRNKNLEDLRSLTLGMRKSALPEERWKKASTTIYECGAQCSASEAFWKGSCDVSRTLCVDVSVRGMGLDNMLTEVINSVLREEEHTGGGNLYRGAKRPCTALLRDIYTLIGGFDRGHIGVSPGVLGHVFRYVQVKVKNESALHGGSEHDSAEERMLQFCASVKVLTYTPKHVREKFRAYRKQDFKRLMEAAQGDPRDAKFLEHCRAELSPEKLAESTPDLRSCTRLGRPKNCARKIPAIETVEDYQAFPVVWPPEYQVTGVFSVLEGVTALRSAGGMSVARARCEAEGGNRAVAWAVVRSVWTIVSHAAARAMERERVGCHLTNEDDYAHVVDIAIAQQGAAAECA
jgi:hypothetical protein